MGPALLQAPLARFGDTAANAGALALLEDTTLPISVKTAAASLAASSCTCGRLLSVIVFVFLSLMRISSSLVRIALMPIDTCKTVLQVEGKNGLTLLAAKIAKSGPTVLWAGGLGCEASDRSLPPHFLS